MLGRSYKGRPIAHSQRASGAFFSYTSCAGTHLYWSHDRRRIRLKIALTVEAELFQVIIVGLTCSLRLHKWQLGIIIAITIRSDIRNHNRLCRPWSCLAIFSIATATTCSDKQTFLKIAIHCKKIIRCHPTRLHRSNKTRTCDHQWIQLRV